MTKSELIRLLNTFPGDPEVIVLSLDGIEGYPIRGVVTDDNSTTPETIRLVTHQLG
jgi:hypothetical protein